MCVFVMSPFSNTMFNVLQTKESNYIFICEMWLFDLVFPKFCRPYMSRYGYFEVFQRVPWTFR